MGQASSAVMKIIAMWPDPRDPSRIVDQPQGPRVMSQCVRNDGQPKVRYATREQAEASKAAQKTRRKARAYRCAYCQGFHLTSKARAS